MKYLTMLGFLLTSGAAVAAPATADNGPAVEKKERKICRTPDDSTSRLPRKRICRTAAEWSAENGGGGGGGNARDQSRDRNR